MNNCTNDFLMLPIVGSREGCQQPSVATTAPNCPETGYPVVVIMSEVPPHGDSAAIRVHPFVGFTANTWVSVSTALNGTPFQGRVMSVTPSGDLIVKNAMADGTPIVTNPAQGTQIMPCSAVAITNEPSNIATVASNRCHPQIPLIGDSERCGIFGLTLGGSALESESCERRTFSVGATRNSFWVENVPVAIPAITPSDTHRVLLWNTATGRFEGLNTLSGGFMQVNATGGAHVSSSLSGTVIPAAPVGGTPTGFVPVLYDPGSKEFIQLPAPAPALVNPVLGWSGGLPVWKSNALYGVESASTIGAYPVIPFEVPIGRAYKVLVTAYLNRLNTSPSSIASVTIDGLRPGVGGPGGQLNMTDSGSVCARSHTLSGRALPYQVSAAHYDHATNAIIISASHEPGIEQFLALQWWDVTP